MSAHIRPATAADLPGVLALYAQPDIGNGKVMAREAGCYKLVLSSNQKRARAHAFYESLGFQRHGFSFSIEI